jgi:hypothetical protein
VSGKDAFAEAIGMSAVVAISGEDRVHDKLGEPKNRSLGYTQDLGDIWDARE